MKTIIESLKDQIFNAEANSERISNKRINVYLRLQYLRTRNTADSKELVSVEQEHTMLTISFRENAERARNLRKALVNVLLADGWDIDEINTASPELCC